MSRGARWTLGSFSLFFAWAFYEGFRQAAIASAGGLVGLGVAVGLCLLIAFACFFRFGRGVIVRLFGALIFLSYVAYFVYEIWIEPGKEYTRRSDPHWINAILGFFVWGLPGLYLARRGMWPSLEKQGAEESEAPGPDEDKGDSDRPFD